MTLAEEYFEYTKQYIASHGKKTIVLMQVGTFFECYAIQNPDKSYKGSLIQEFATINDMAIAHKNICIGNENVVMAGFGVNYLDKYVKKLLEHGYTVPVFVQDSQSKNTTRSLAYIYSPGTYFNNNESSVTGDDSLNCNYNNGLSNNTICIWLHISKANKIIKEDMMTIGLSMIDVLTGKLINYEYSEPYIDSPTAYDELEKYISIYNPSETILITNNIDDYDGNYLDIVISYANINSQKYHKIYLHDNKSEQEGDFEKIALNCEKQIYQEEMIDKIYGIGSYLEKHEFREYSYANQSLCFLLDFVYKHNQTLIKDIDYPIFENHSNKLVLANHSLKQLNIINDERYSGKMACVANLLNNCVTNAGKRKFNYELLNPINDINELNKSYSIIDDLRESKFHETIKEYLMDIRDIEKIERKLIMKNINPKDFFILFNNLSKVKELFQKISKKKDKKFIKYIRSYLDYDIDKICDELINYLKESLNIEKCSHIVLDKLSNYNLQDLKFINKNYNEDLNVLFKNSFDSREQLEGITKFISNLIVDFERKPKNGGTVPSKKGEISETKDKKETKNKNKKNNEDELKDSDEENNKKEDKDDKEDTNYLVKIHETAKNDPILIATKRRCVMIKEIMNKIIEKSGQYYEIPYKSSYLGTEELLNLDLQAIEYKIHGNNQNSMIIYSGHINDIASSIQNSKDYLIEGILKHFSNILRDFDKINKNERNKNTKPKSSTKSNMKNNNNSQKNNTYLNIISRFIGLVDLCFCKTYNAVKYNYCKPSIEQNNNNNKSFFKFKKIRHCLIEHLNTKELYVTNDYELGNNDNGMLLYGTNAVGKTSFIKSIGICIILAQAGMYVPCEEFIFYPYSYLFTRILGNDNIFKGLSTFAVEMCELRTILKQSTTNSIILGDELCSGTESTSALSIFVSSLERLHNINSTFLFATHFHEILEYEEIKKLEKMNIHHMSVIFDRQQNLLIYDRKLKEGPGEAMYGLEVCKSLDLPNDFIERAYQIRNKYHNKNEDILEGKQSTYNSKKIIKNCEICKVNKGTEIHHLQYQKNADKNGIINGEFSKNHKANLINICEKCHNKIHKNEEEYKVTKTNKGYVLQKI